jgi:hypothetical protein
MQRTLIAASAALAIALTIPISLLAKGRTTRITLESADRTIEIADPILLQNFNVWAGAGTWMNDVEGTEGFIIDWQAGIVTERPAGLQRFEVSFYVKYLNRPFETQQDQLAYVVSYEHNPAAKEGFVYLPGKGDDAYSVNMRAIGRGGREGNWFRASKLWTEVVSPLIERATANTRR